MSKQIIKDGVIIDKPDTELLSLEEWNQGSNDTDNTQAGLLLASHDQLDDFNGNLQDLSLIAIDFPVFTDGRGYSLAAQLRGRYQYKGELRAQGAIHRDQLYMLKRCGFNALDFADEQTDLNAALASLNDFSDDYQVSANQPEPLFLRR